MRLSAVLTLLALAGLAAGCGKGPAGAAGAGAAPVPDEVRDRWKLVKVELPTAAGPCVEEYAGTEFAILKPTARPAEPIPVDRIPPTPAEFSHEHHAGQLGIDCRYCHAAGEKPVAVTVEGRVKGCMNCHQQFWPGADAPPRGRIAATGLRGKRWTFTAARDATKTPKEIDLTECDADGRPLPGRTVQRGIYEEKDGGLRIALAFGAVPGDFRPKEFKPSSQGKAGGSAFAGVAVLHLKK